MTPKKAKDSFLMLRLYIAGESANSLTAISNLQTIAKDYLPDSHKIEIVDILADPIVALDDGILVTPTLVKIGSLPIRLIIGDLSDQAKVLQALGGLTRKPQKVESKPEASS